MTKRNRIAAITMSLILVLGSASAYAAVGRGNMPFGRSHKANAVSVETTTEEATEEAKEVKDNFKGRRPDGKGKLEGEKPEFKAPEMTEEQKAELIEKKKEQLDTMLEKEIITQEQYDEAIAKLEAGELGFGFGFGKMNGNKGFGKREFTPFDGNKSFDNKGFGNNKAFGGAGGFFGKSPFNGKTAPAEGTETEAEDTATSPVKAHKGFSFRKAGNSSDSDVRF